MVAEYQIIVGKNNEIPPLRYLADIQGILFKEFIPNSNKALKPSVFYLMVLFKQFKYLTAVRLNKV